MFDILKNKKGNLLTGLLTKNIYLNNKQIQDSIKQLIKMTYFYTSFEPNHLSVRNYIIKNNITANDLICKREDCKNNVKFRTLKKGFSSFCSQKCVNLDKNIKQKRKDTMLKNYGVEHALLNLELNQKMKESYNRTMCIKYNKQHVFNQHIINYDYWNDREYIENNFIDNEKHFLLTEFKTFFNCQQSAANKKLVDLNIKYVKRTGVSLAEYELIEWLENNNITNIIKNSRNIISNELDIYLPDLNIAIEFNGEYWHSYCEDKSKNVSPKQSDLKYQKYHRQEKSIECMNKNITLFHIDETNIDEIKDLIILQLTMEPITQHDDTIIIDLLIDNGLWLISQDYNIISINEPEFIMSKGRKVFDAGTITYTKNKN